MVQTRGAAFNMIMAVIRAHCQTMKAKIIIPQLDQYRPEAVAGRGQPSSASQANSF